MTDFDDWLLDRYSEQIPDVVDLGDDDQEMFKRAAVAYLFGADYFDQLATQTPKDWAETLRVQMAENDIFLQSTTEDTAATDAALSALSRRSRGKPVQERDRRLIRAVANEWQKRGRDVQLQASDAMADSIDRPTDFSRECERFIRLIDPDRKQMPKRKAYRGALPTI